ncbi:hypothetical protein PkoCFBP13504_27300 [Pseudomonas koreensis]|nr:hypothetical protein PkoCFBP13504_27300 [Pseudomonas koreensis]
MPLERHRLFCARHFCIHRRTLWERACSRRRQYIQHLCFLTHRFREQARSHRLRCVGLWEMCLSYRR